MTALLLVLAKLATGEMTQDELLRREREILEDMRVIEEKIGKEIWDIEALAEKNK